MVGPLLARIAEQYRGPDVLRSPIVRPISSWGRQQGNHSRNREGKGTTRSDSQPITQLQSAGNPVTTRNDQRRISVPNHM